MQRSGSQWSEASGASGMPGHSSCLPGVQGPVLREGYLTKQGGSRGGRRNWKSRYFVLSGDGLRYYKDVKAFRNGKSPKGQFLFESLTSIRDRVATEDLRHFQLCGDGRTMIIRGDSDAIRREWTRALSETWAQHTAETLGVKGAAHMTLGVADGESGGGGASEAALDAPPAGHRRSLSSMSARVRASDSQLKVKSSTSHSSIRGGGGGGGKQPARPMFARETSVHSLMHSHAPSVSPSFGNLPSRSASRCQLGMSSDNLASGEGFGGGGGAIVRSLSKAGAGSSSSSVRAFQRSVDSEVRTVAESVRRMGAGAGGATNPGAARRRLDAEASDLYNFAHDAAELARRYESVAKHAGVARAQLDLLAAVRNQVEAIEAAAAAASRPAVRLNVRSESGCSMDLPGLNEEDGVDLPPPPPMEQTGGACGTNSPQPRPLHSAFSFESMDVPLPPPPAVMEASQEGGGGGGGGDATGMPPPPAFNTGDLVGAEAWPSDMPLPPPPAEAPPADDLPPPPFQEEQFAGTSGFGGGATSAARSRFLSRDPSVTSGLQAGTAPAASYVSGGGGSAVFGQPQSPTATGTRPIQPPPPPPSARKSRAGRA